MIRKSSLALSIALMCAVVHASEKTDTALVKRLESRVGAGQIQSITPTKYGSLFEVRLKNDVVYTDKTGKYLFAGRVIETDTGISITDERVNEINRIDFKSLPLEYAIKFTKGNGKRVVAVFEDPNCGYCTKLRKTIQELDNITVYTFPLDILTAESKEKSTDIWCSADRSKAWDEWMLNRKAPEKAASNCTGVHDKVLELGNKYNVRSTPTIFFADGMRVPGAINATKFEEKFAKLK